MSEEQKKELNWDRKEDRLEIIEHHMEYVDEKLSGNDRTIHLRFYIEWLISRIEELEKMNNNLEKRLYDAKSYHPYIMNHTK